MTMIARHSSATNVGRLRRRKIITDSVRHTSHLCVIQDGLQEERGGEKDNM